MKSNPVGGISDCDILKSNPVGGIPDDDTVTECIHAMLQAPVAYSTYLSKKFMFVERYIDLLSLFLIADL